MNFTLNKNYKHRYIRVNEREGLRLTVSRRDVSFYNKLGVKQAWDEEDAKFPNDKFISCLEQTNDPLPCFFMKKYA